MTTLHSWDDARREISDDEDIAAIDEGTAEMVAAVRLATMRKQLGLRTGRACQ